MLLLLQEGADFSLNFSLNPGSIAGGIFGYLYTSICLMLIANKTDTPGAFLAWVPLLNVFLLFQISGRPLWWIILLLIPPITFVIAILVFWGLAQERGKAPAWGLLLIVPVVNIFALGYLAFSD